MSNPLDTFYSEMQELIEELEQALISLEEIPSDKETINQVFRVMHTIKGTSGMFGFVALSSLTHYLEEVFDDIRNGQATVTDDVISLSLTCRDEIEALLYTDKEKGTERTNKLIEQIKCLQDMLSVNTPSPVAEDIQHQCVDIAIHTSADSFLMGLKPVPVLRELAELGEASCQANIDRLKSSLNEFDPHKLYLDWDVSLSTSASLQDIQDVFIFVNEDWSIKVKKQASKAIVPTVSCDEAQSEDAAFHLYETEDSADNTTIAAPISQPAPTSTVEECPQTPQTKAGTSLKVSSTKLDELMDLVGEMVIAQTRLNQLGHLSSDPSLEVAVETMARLVDNVRDNALSMRMLQVGTLFSRFKRLVRDTSKDLGKKIELVTEGEETELDKTVIDRLSDPLVHLVRNSIDHGIELPATREQAGKPEAGTIRLRAMHADSNVVILIEDDGGGIDAQAVMNKARQKGVISPDQTMTDEEALNLIFEPGFSTAETVSQLSGRGVGMDAVKRTIEALNGKVELSSQKGNGTTVRITLPLTMAIIEGLHVRVGESDYVIPLSKVNECMEGQHCKRTVEVLNLRGQCIPQISLADWFRLNESNSQQKEIVIAGDGQRQFGLVVDQIVGQQQTVVKGLSPVYENVAGVSGATILGDGNVALIIDVDHLFAAVSTAQDRYQLH